MYQTNWDDIASWDQALLVYAACMMPSGLERIQNLLLFGGEFIYKDNYETHNHWRVSDKSARHLMLTSMKVFAIVSISLICYLLFPAYAYFVLNQHPLALPVELPFIDVATDSGYYINIAHQACYSFVGIPGVIAIELLNCMLKNNIYAAKESIIYSLDVLATMLRENTTSSMQTKSEFRSVLIWIDLSSN